MAQFGRKVQIGGPEAPWHRGSGMSPGRSLAEFRPMSRAPPMQRLMFGALPHILRPDSDQETS
ncbi:hypothetical protein C9E82_16815 [Paracoccus siganidrum]|uniref:Uncharacterized protein n=1 Tax=Paracoccus siganidrum TaxID=1276757 RepID=A0A419AC88_9RHOB|nr:hypothetical protein D3P05_01380 [Paracoccus siganidrum]RMC30912.1 hypothetical protein C9E82_16815 [Paracoccus siganidrum]